MFLLHRPLPGHQPIANLTGETEPAAVTAHSRASPPPPEDALEDRRGDQEAATIRATPAIQQLLLRVLVLSWLTKFGGNLRIGEERLGDRLTGKRHAVEGPESGLREPGWTATEL